MTPPARCSGVGTKWPRNGYPCGAWPSWETTDGRRWCHRHLPNDLAADAKECHSQIVHRPGVYAVGLPVKVEVQR